MFRFLGSLIFIGLLGGGVYSFYYMGYDFKDVKNTLTALVSDTGLFSKEMEWIQNDFKGNDKFTFDKPVDYVIEEDEENGVVLLKSSDNGESDVTIAFEELAEIKLPGTASSTAESVETVIVSGQTATILKGKEGENNVAYIPVPGGGQVVVSGKGKVFEETYQHIDVSPSVANWSIFGKELPETIRIAKILDSYLASISSQILGGEVNNSVKGNLIITIKDQSVSYIGFGDGANQQALILDTNVKEGESPKVLGFYKLPIVKNGSRYIVKGESGEAVAILPTSSMILEKDSGGEWR